MNRKYIEAARKLNSYPDGKQILTLMKSKRVVAFSDMYVKSINKLVQDYDNLKQGIK